jgi:hypothetical protein
MAKRYRVKATFAAKKPDAVTLVTRGNDKIAVALIGKDITVELKGTKSGPPITRTVPGATQEDLKYLFEIEKHPFIEEYESNEGSSAVVKG